MVDYNLKTISNQISYVDFNQDLLFFRTKIFKNDKFICDKLDLVDRKNIINSESLFNNILSNVNINFEKFNYISSLCYLTEEQKKWLLTPEFASERYFEIYLKNNLYKTLFDYSNNPWKKIVEDKDNPSGLTLFLNGVFCDVNYHPLNQVIFFELKDMLKYFPLLRSKEDKINIINELLNRDNIFFIKNNFTGNEDKDLIANNFNEVIFDNCKFDFCFIPTDSQMKNIFSNIISHSVNFNYPFYLLDNIKKSIVELGYIDCLNDFRLKEGMINYFEENMLFTSDFKF